MQSITTLLPQKRERNYGIDLLRVVSMLMVVVLHVLGKGGVLKNLTPLSHSYEAAWFLEIASYCAVNCYALISGYVGVGTRFKYTNIVYIWLQVIAYNVSLAFAAAILHPNIGRAEVIDAFFPVSNRAYWYFTAYFCIFFFIPIFNKAIELLSEKQLKAVGIAMVVIFTVLPLLAEKDSFNTVDGYSPIWLAVLYIFGGIMKKCKLFEKTKAYILLLMYFLCVIISWLQKMYVEYNNINFPDAEEMKALLVEYTSPTIFFAAVFLVAAFSKIKAGKISSKIITVFSSVSFGVYLIHVQPQVWQRIIKDMFVDYADFGALKLAVTVILTAFAIYLICGAMDFIREKIFSLLRIKKLLTAAEKKIFKDLWSEDAPKSN